MNVNVCIASIFCIAPFLYIMRGDADQQFNSFGFFAISLIRLNSTELNRMCGALIRSYGQCFSVNNILHTLKEKKTLSSLFAKTRQKQHPS